MEWKKCALCKRHLTVNSLLIFCFRDWLEYRITYAQCYLPGRGRYNYLPIQYYHTTWVPVLRFFSYSNSIMLCIAIFVCFLNSTPGEKLNDTLIQASLAYRCFCFHRLFIVQLWIVLNKMCTHVSHITTVRYPYMTEFAHCCRHVQISLMSYRFIF